MATQARSTPASNRTARRLTSCPDLHDLMRRFQVKDLVNVDVESFMQTLGEFEQLEVRSGPTL